MEAVQKKKTYLPDHGHLRSGLRALAMLAVLGLAACAATPVSVDVPSADSVRGPDLVIASFTITDEEWGLGLQANAQVVVRNRGAQPAPPFEVSIAAVNREGNLIPFSFNYDSSLLPAELGAGQEMTISGETGLYWHAHFDILCAHDNYDATQCAMHDAESVWLVALADYCEGDGVPAHCAVEETDEMNNTSGPHVVRKVPDATPEPIDTPLVLTDTPEPATDTPIPATNTPEPTPTPDAVVRAAGLNVRAGPGMEYDILDQVKRGDVLDVLGQAYDCGWLRVVTPQGTVGWVSGKPTYVARHIRCSAVAAADIPPPPTSAPTNTLVPRPIVVLMDRGAFLVQHNAQVLAQLPVDVVQEITSPDWVRHDYVRSLQPDLIVIHLSAFCSLSDCEANIWLDKLIQFVTEMDQTGAKFLFYSSGPLSDGNMKQVFPFLSDEENEARIYTLSSDYGDSETWDPALRTKVRTALGLP